MSNPYKLPDLSSGGVLARLKRVERTVQYPKGGRLADTTNDSLRGSNFRTVAASEVDRDGKIIASGKTTIINNSGGSSSFQWGGIGGQIANQLDLQLALFALSQQDQCHDEVLSDGAGNIIFAGGDVVMVTHVPD